MSTRNYAGKREAGVDDNEKPFVRTVIMSDLHCGHRVGITPPSWRIRQGSRYFVPQEEMWRQYTLTLDMLKPIDKLICNGDAIDGDGGKSGGVELIVTDRLEQAAMAVEVIEYAQAKKHAFIYGTGYHTGLVEDFEDEIAKHFLAPISGQEQYNINGTIIDCKHKIGNSSIPHGKGTAISKERLWNVIWAEHEEQEKADIIIRSHVHYYWACEESTWLGIITPALQGQGTKFGSRQCSGHVDFGLVWIDCYHDGGFTWGKSILPLQSQKRKAIIL
jgi:hypothetical protein